MKPTHRSFLLAYTPLGSLGAGFLAHLNLSVW